MSIQHDAVPFVPRPWPSRAPSESPLRGRRVLVVDGDLEHAREVATHLTRLGCVNRAVPPTDLAEALAAESWQVVLAAPDGLDLAQLPHDVSLAGILPDDGELPAPLAARALAFVSRRPSDEDLRTALGHAFERIDVAAENQRLRAALRVRGTFGAVMTRDPSMHQVLRTLEAVAETRANILLLGESGTGKTRLAQAVHAASDRSGGPFVVVNCGALPDNLLESELFGHVMGAFSGALRDRAGRFEQADGGTIFLDEINSASLEMQVKLLRVLQERTFERVGDSGSISVDVRIVAASNQDLTEEIAAGRFREDLYWRLHVVAVELPPLRARPGDVALLAEHFLGRYAADYNKPTRRLHVDAMALLAGHDWPGNVRQLENVLERAVLLSTGEEVLPRDLGAALQAPDSRGAEDAAPTEGTLLLGLENLERLPPLKEALSGPERQLLVRALELTGGNRTEAARMLGINRTTLFNKMRKYGLMTRNFEAVEPRQ